MDAGILDAKQYLACWINRRVTCWITLLLNGKVIVDTFAIIFYRFVQVPQISVFLILSFSDTFSLKLSLEV
jgi:hypothetical protein